MATTNTLRSLRVPSSTPLTLLSLSEGRFILGVGRWEYGSPAGRAGSVPSHGAAITPSPAIIVTRHRPEFADSACIFVKVGL